MTCVFQKVRCDLIRLEGRGEGEEGSGGMLAWLGAGDVGGGGNEDTSC